MTERKRQDDRLRAVLEAAQATLEGRSEERLLRLIAGVACAVDVDQMVAAHQAGRAADIVQVAREALSNVGRHAAAATCRLSLWAEPGFAVVQVEDDGRGFVPGEGGGGWGLRNLDERATALGGSLEIASVPGEGTRVTFRIPT